MRLIVALLLALHGVAHFAGFRAAFWPTPIQPRRRVYLPRQVEGAAWLLLGVGFIGVAVLLLLHQDAWHALLLWSAGGSLLLCLFVWPTAKIGLVLDAGLVVLAIVLTPSETTPYLTTAFQRELGHASAYAASAPREIVDEPAIARLSALHVRTATDRVQRVTQLIVQARGEVQ
jgi:hypothetical protein